MPPRAAVAVKVECLTDAQLADEIGVGVEAVRAWRRQGKGPDFMKVEGLRGSVRYPRPWVNEWLESRRVRMANTA